MDDRDFDESVDLRAIGLKLLANPLWIIIGVIAFAAVFEVIAIWTRPIYRATTIVAPASPEGEVSSAAGVSGALGGLAAGLGLGPKDEETEESLAVLRSRQFTEAFLSQRNLLPELFPSKWDAKSQRWKNSQEGQPTLAEAYHYFDKRIRSISEDPKSGLVTIQIDWTNQKEAAEWANGMIGQLNDEMRQRAITQADASMKFLENEVQSAGTVEERTAIAHLMETQVRRRMLAHVTRDYSFRVVDRAIASDGERPIWPRKALMLALGATFGLIVGAIGAMIFGRAPRNHG
ncbi:MAG: Wzz/FepE/Etk N-terminal domain-containing protein [Steroidobacteraceae bacterium]